MILKLITLLDARFPIIKQASFLKGEGWDSELFIVFPEGFWVCDEQNQKGTVPSDAYSSKSIEVKNCLGAGLYGGFEYGDIEVRHKKEMVTKIYKVNSFFYSLVKEHLLEEMENELRQS